MQEHDAPWELYHFTTVKLAEAEWQAIKHLADEKGSTVSAEMRLAAQRHLAGQMPPYDEKKTIHFSHGDYLIMLARWNVFAMPKRELEFVSTLLALIDAFEKTEQGDRSRPR
jgi:hypothetical protein